MADMSNVSPMPASLGHRPPASERVGDAERTRVCELLRAHVADGRLELDEFDERVERAVQARTHGDLREALRDLPHLPHLPPRTPSRLPERRQPATGWTYAAVATGVVGLAGVVTLMLLGSVVLGIGTFVFSVIGGTLATIVGGGSVWLYLASPARRTASPRSRMGGPEDFGAR